MKVLKIVGKAVGILILLLILSLITLFLMRNRIANFVVNAVEDYYDIELKYDGVSISVYRNFPQITLGVKQLQVNKKPDSSKLAEFDELALAVDFYSLWSTDEPLQIHSFSLDRPILLYEVYEDSTTNWDSFFTTDETEQEGEPLKLSLKNYQISNGSLYYIDNSSSLSAEITGFTHSGKGELSSVEFNLDTRTSIESVQYSDNDLSIHLDYPINADVVIHINTEKETYTFSDAKLQIADILTSLDGQVQGIRDGYEMDISIQESSSDIQQLLSLVPESFIADYKDLSSSGSLSIQGKIQGKFIADSDIYPAVDIRAEVRNAKVQYPDLPENISDLNFIAHISKEEGNLDLLRANLNPLSFKLGNNPPFTMRLLAVDLFRGPGLSGEIRGSIDLGALASAVPVDMIKSMKGLVKTDMLFDFYYPDLEREEYEKVKLDGTFEVSSAEIITDDYPMLSIKEVKGKLSPNLLDIATFDISLGRTDLNGTANLENPIVALTGNKLIKGSVKARSTYTDTNEFMGDSEEVDGTAEESMVPDLFKRLDLDIDYKANKFIYDTYELNTVHVPARIKDEKVHLNNLTFNYDNSPFTVNGELQSVMDYLYKDNGVVNGTVDVRGNSFDLWKFMNSGEESTPSGAAEVFSLPEQMNLEINTLIGSVSYENFTLKNLNAGLHLVDQLLTINRGTAGLFNGNIGLTGTFKADGKALPAYDFNYSMKEIPFQDAYRDIVTFKQLAPIAEYLSGVFGTNLKIKGVLTKDFMPDFNSLDLAGVVETVNTRLMNFKILNAISDKLQIQSFKEIKLENTTNYIDIEKGTFSVKPFAVKLDQIDATIQGSQKITGDQINYTIASKIPRAWLDKNAITGKVNMGLDWVKEQAAQYNINLDAGEYLYVDILLGGSIKDPKVALQLKDVGGKSLKESVKEEMERNAKRAEDSIKAAIDREKREMERLAKARMDSIKKAAEEEAKRKAKEVLTGQKDTTKKGGSLEDELKKAGEDAKKKVDDLKDKFNKWKKS